MEPKIHHQTSVEGVQLQVITVDIASPKGEAEGSHHHHTQTQPIAQDAWLPITSSRKGNTCNSAFHLLSSGIGIQALALPIAFTALGWFWGILLLSLAFLWQLYTTWLLVNLHESDTGIRYSRFLHLSITAFGLKLGKFLAIFPVMYLSGGTCVILIIIGGGTMESFYQMVCGDGRTCNSETLSGAEWFLVFVCLAIAVALFFPNLNSLAGISVIGAITAIVYCTLLWVMPIAKGRPDGITYDPSKTASTDMDRIRGVLNAIGLIALSFRGHNLVLEIQGTMPSSPKHSSVKPMWRGVKMSYLLISLCMFPLAIGGYWAYGNAIANGGKLGQKAATAGMLSAFLKFHKHNTSKFVMGLIHVIVFINCASLYQIYAMPVLDNLQRIYVTKKNKPCPKWLRSGFKVFFGGVTFFISVTFPFLSSLAPIIGGIALPLTFVYPCFMWMAINKPRPHGAMWCLNLGLGCLGVTLSFLIVAGGVWNVVSRGLDANFFNPY
ncbi:lysine histidine transporter-like 8 [Cornus florida]|uniref:lysine histidine transporter-like 8 n=1 Tax=Cornus florida TaxID=4283 RepID=UPI00289CBAFE|nr:lysine histidine transporter-like 8 [Cornus florida]